MDLLHLVDRLEELVASAQKMPIGNRAIVDRRRMLDLIDQMRVAIPHEVREAQDIVAQRDGIRREAEEDGRIIVARAEERAADLVEEHSITEAAKHRAEEIASEAERRLEQQIEAANRDIQHRIQESRRLAREQMEAADEYARELLVRLERQLQAFQSSVRAGVQQLEPQAPSFSSHLPPLDDRDFDEGQRTPDWAAEPVAEAPRRGAERAPTGREAARGREVSRTRDGAAEGEDLENLLRPRTASMALDEDAPGVIDDFEHEPLDDDPMLRPSPRPSYEDDR
ncbi:MAG: hypothetical protein WEA81_06720 [Dehalococcoidia bacterium]